MLLNRFVDRWWIAGRGLQPRPKRLIAGRGLQPRPKRFIHNSFRITIVQMSYHTDTIP
jgi:hypothetical protein